MTFKNALSDLRQFLGTENYEAWSYKKKKHKKIKAYRKSV